MKARLLPWLCLCWLAGCASMDSATSVDAIRPEEYDRYVVVTLRNPHTPVVPRAGSSVRNYESAGSYSVSPAARSSARAVAIAHGLREVAAWPIALLEVHCLVYALPAGADRRTTSRLSRRSAMPASTVKARTAIVA